MLNSKALKPGNRYDTKNQSKFYMWWLESNISGYYYDTLYAIKKPFKQIKKLYDWYVNVFKDDFDFDAHSLFAIIEYKLKRVQTSLTNGNAIQEDKDLHALELAIKLAGRLKVDNYEDRQHRHHDAKWGKTVSWFTPCDDGTGNSIWNTSKPNAVTEEEKAQEKKEFLDLYKISGNIRNRDEKWLYSILKNHLRNLWD